MRLKTLGKLLIVLMLSLFAAGCFSLFCNEDLIEEANSPNEERVATTFVRDCGATTNYGTRVEVRWRSSNRTEHDVILSVDGKPEIKVEWIDEQTLRVKCSECIEDRVYLRVTKLGKIKIEFEQ